MDWSQPLHSLFPFEKDPRHCKACDCRSAVKRISFDEVDLIASRYVHFNVNSFKELSEKVNPNSILSYLHNIEL